MLESSLRRVGGRVWITVKLVSAVDGYHLFSETFERGWKQMLAAEEEIPRRVLAAMRPYLPAGTPVAPSYTPLPAAHGAYWRGRYLLRLNPGPKGRTQAAAQFEEAVRLDPRYAEAWASLASVLSTQAFHEEGSNLALAGRAKACAQQALAANPDHPRALASLAQILFAVEQNWPEVERLYRRALRRNPSYTFARQGLALGLLSRGRFQDALAEVNLAIELDPLSAVVANDKTTILYVARRCDEAMQNARQVLTVAPDFHYARVILGACHSEQGRYGEAVAEFEQAVRGIGREPFVLGRLGHALALAGRREEAESLRREIELETKSGSGPNIGAGFVHAGLKDIAGAVTALERAQAQRETDVNFVAVEPVFQPLRADPRFRALLRRLNLPEL